MINFKIRIASKVIEISCLHEDTKELCSNYLVEGNPDFFIAINQSDIDFERQKSINEAMYEGNPVYDYSDGYLETLAVYRKIVNELLKYNICLFHGAAVAVNDEGYLFTAKSGTGKTTHINLWLKKFNDCEVINGDKPLLMIKEDKVYVCGTPWSGKENLNCNKIVPLKAICILERGVDNHIEEINFKEAFDMMISQIYKPLDSKLMKNTILLINDIGKKVKLYKLKCNMEEEAAEVSYKGMNNEL